MFCHRTKRTALFLLSSIAAGVCLCAPRADAGLGRVRICHHADQQETLIITVAASAVAGHQRHGDWPVSAELCDGVDNDCNGVVDDGLGTTTCGLGVCRATVDNCVAGTPQTCTPGIPAPSEVCTNGLDDDCDGGADCDDTDCAGCDGCPRDSGEYADYFRNHPTVTAASIARFDPATQCLVTSFLNDLEATGTLFVDRPADMANPDPEGEIDVPLTAAEAQRIVAAKAAHAIWLDKNGLVPWPLEDYTADELRGLFDEALLFPDRRYWSVVDHSPAEVFAYVRQKDLIRENRLATMHAVLRDLRADFYHGGSSYYGDPLTAYTVFEALTTYSDRGHLLARIARLGCQSMARIVVGVLRAVNIPGEVVTSGWFYLYHATAVWPAVERVLPHGDDIYSGTLRAIPDDGLLVPFAFYDDPANTAVCGADRVCLSNRHRALGAVAYPDDWTTPRCCAPDSYGYASCEDYFAQSYRGVLTPDEIAAAAIAVAATCGP